MIGFLLYLFGIATGLYAGNFNFRSRINESVLAAFSAIRKKSSGKKARK